MPQYQNHICFISDQNVAELLGAKLPELGCTRVHAVVTSKMEKDGKGKIFKKVCKKNGIPCNLYPLAQIRPQQIELLLDSIWFDKPDESWAVNITGGTKIMSLVAYTWAVRNQIDAFYIDTENQTVQVYNENRWHEHPLPRILKLETLLNLYGYEIESRKKGAAAKATLPAACGLIRRASKGAGIKTIHALNALAVKASSDSSLAARYYPEPNLDAVLAICKSAGHIDYTDSLVIFRDNEALSWCKGLWLEEYVQGVLARLAAENRISSWASSVTLSSNGTRNELDAVFTANNRLFVIECKTSRQDNAGTTASILYKADSINGRVGGIFTRSMLCSIDALKQEESNRAQSMGIKTVIGSNLDNLRKIIMEWIDTK